MVAEWIWIEKWQAGRLGEAEVEVLREEAHARTARAMLGMVRAEGGIFIKMGQHMCASPVLPRVYVETLRVLMDNAIARPVQETEKTWRDEIGGELRGEFAQFREEPIATASLAQVYDATLPDGRRVAVKVQHRDVARLFKVDMRIAEAYYGFLSLFFPGLDFSFAVQEMDRAFSEELDFNLEATNGRKAREMFQRPGSPVVVPAIVDRLSTRRVLVMEYEEGFRVDNVEAMRRAGLEPRLVAKTLISLFSEMMFVRGFVHCDPHPGNILVRPAPGTPEGFKLILLDHGTYQTLPPSVRLTFARIWKGVISANQRAVEDATAEFGIDRKYGRFVGFILTFSPPTKDPLVADERVSHKEVEGMIENLLEVEDIHQAHDKVVEFSQMFEKLPRELLLIIKTNNLLRFLNEQLGSPVNRFAIMGKYCLEGLAEAEAAEAARRGAVSSRGLAVMTRGYLEELRMRVVIWLAPLLQWAYIDVYLRVTAPKMRQLLLAKQGERVNFLA